MREFGENDEALNGAHEFEKQELGNFLCFAINRNLINQFEIDSKAQRPSKIPSIKTWFVGPLITSIPTLEVSRLRGSTPHTYVLF